MVVLFKHLFIKFEFIKLYVYSIDNDDEYEVGLQSNDYHSTSNYEKMEQKHEDMQCKAIGII